MPEKLSADSSDDICVLGGELDPAKELTNIVHPVSVAFFLQEINLQQCIFDMVVHPLKFEG